MAVAIEGAAKVSPGPPAPVHALGPVDLVIEPGSFVALLGPSGCGKSTLLSMIAGLEAPTAGRIAIDGRAVRGPRTDIGIVFQSPVLVDWRDVLGNVLLQADLRGLDRRALEPRARELLRSVGLDAFLHRRPWELSGGMQQRTAFCRALVHDPPLVLMDEPLGALDAMTREQLRADLEALWMRTRKTMILVTHAIDEAVQLADRVIVISPRPGRIVRDLAIDLPRPRDLEVCESPPFHARVAEIKRIFQGYGVSEPAPPPAAAAAVSRLRLVLDRATGSLFALGFFAAWEAAVRLLEVPLYIAPPPSSVLWQLWRNLPRIAEYALVTGGETLGGFLLAVFLGVPLALAVAFSPLLRRTFYPAAVTLEMVRKIAFAPLSVTWFGFGYLPKLVIMFLVCFFPILLNGILAFTSLPPELGRLCLSTGAGPWRTFGYVRLPAAGPQLFVGIKGAAVNATVGATIAEWIGGDAGLGYYIQIATGDLRMDLAFAIILVLAALGLALFGLVVLVERWLIPRHVSQRIPLGRRPSR